MGLPALTEADFQRSVIELAQRLGWLVAHFRPAQVGGRWQTAVQGDGAGFPDLCMVRGERLILAELKAEKGRIRPEQRKWLDALQVVHDAPVSCVESYVWRPSDWDRIVEVLR